MALTTVYHLIVSDEADDKTGRLQPESIRFFSREEVALHNHPGSCWLIVDRNVYDVTSFLKKHPAGDTSILKKAGKDASRDFHFHTERSKRVWAPYLIGRLEEEQCSCLIM